MEVLQLNNDCTGFINKVRRGKCLIGDSPGYPLEGYTYLMLDGKAYPAHHLMWLWHKGELPPKGFDIDHEDLRRDNNHITNLRLATRSQNMLNTKAHKDSRSGIKNVFFRRDTGKWAVRLTVNGKYKSFGSFEDLELAELVAEEAREKYHGEFANG